MRLKFASLILITILGVIFFYSWNKPLSFRFNQFKPSSQELGGNQSTTKSLRTPTISLRAVTKKPVETVKKVLTPPPLRSPVETELTESLLTRAGVITSTNLQRRENGLGLVYENERLDLTAAQKLNDMFGKQYFAHISPSGLGVKDFVKDAGYEYILIGENLALGNFQDDEKLVQAWMGSPGHRANILNPRYTEIGVAVGKGIFEGRTVWLAVQHFGLPLSACPEPSKSLSLEIEAKKNEIKELQKIIESLKVEIDNTQDPAEYNKKVGKYNDLVARYNNLVKATRADISQYNSQVSLFNSCAVGE